MGLLSTTAVVSLVKVVAVVVVLLAVVVVFSAVVIDVVVVEDEAVGFSTEGVVVVWVGLFPLQQTSVKLKTGIVNNARRQAFTVCFIKTSPFLPL